jgi:hypothetical protein
VKLDVDTLVTVPTTPPAAGPDRALDPALAAGRTFAVCPALAPAEPLLEVALTIPYAPPPIATTAAPMARGLLGVRISICDLFRVAFPQPKMLAGPGARL